MQLINFYWSGALNLRVHRDSSCKICRLAQEIPCRYPFLAAQMTVVNNFFRSSWPIGQKGKVERCANHTFSLQGGLSKTV